MKIHSVILLSACLAVLAAPGARALDEGQTQPKLSKKDLVLTTLSGDMIPTTNGAGNVKGVLCLSASSSVLSNVQIHFYVDGGSAQTITLSSYPFLLDSASNYNTGIIPMNIRFDTSIRIGVQRSSQSAEVSCMASWALD